MYKLDRCLYTNVCVVLTAKVTGQCKMNIFERKATFEKKTIVCLTNTANAIHFQVAVKIYKSEVYQFNFSFEQPDKVQRVKENNRAGP